jgi:outer membrane protein OmpA-like peptidoglycan-associated protein
MRLNLFFILLFICFNLFAQKKPSPYHNLECQTILNSADIDSAININYYNKIFLNCSPKGAGSKVEVASGKKNDLTYFEEEHNVMWIKFKALRSGDLIFTINPKNPQNDYDFLLFKSDGEDAIQRIKTKKQKPIRSNLSRNNETTDGITGLSFNAKKTHVNAGPNDEYSSVLKVEKGEEYFLVIDNVYDDGQGALIVFDYYETKKITGFVTNEAKDKKITAEVTLEDTETGTPLQSTKSDPKTGYFEMIVTFVVNNPDKLYTLVVDAEQYLFEETMFSVAELKNLNPIPLNIALSDLKKGKRLKINNIHFKGGSPDFITAAKSSLKRLNKLMQKNETLKILIEGHVNGCDEKNAIDPQLLSERRSLRVKKYLFEEGIDDERMKTIGYSCTKMLFPTPTGEIEMQLNRRVEILVLEY